MTRFYLTGQNTFSNRGCEAIVRSTVKALNQEFTAPTILVPSNSIAQDQQLWPEHAAHGVQFVPNEHPMLTRLWAHIQRLPIAFIQQMPWPFGLSARFKAHIDSVDVVISTGGDNYSLDYRLPSLLTALDHYAQSQNKLSVLFGASVGPFEKQPHYVPVIQTHLKNFNTLYVRETYTQRYLTQNLNLTNVQKMVDPAFILDSQPIDFQAFWPIQAGQGVIGINISPLIERYTQNNPFSLREETIEFIQFILATTDYAIILVPHVIETHRPKNNDATYMAPIQNAFAHNPAHAARVTSVPPYLNAAQLKYIIQHTRFFIGARTHATIAALSSQVPTLSISYSVKAIGINLDIFGTDTLVLPIQQLTQQTLIKKMYWLIDNETQIKQQLSRQIPHLQQGVLQAVRDLQAKTPKVPNVVQ